ncbi:hypothetical protein QE152_g33245 [Popillia japonica]|uniref:Ribosomal protein S14 n=1 Tax=Popillia japonica TaxID=7064 RepID=A0AAW1IXG5_POPJA
MKTRARIQKTSKSTDEQNKYARQINRKKKRIYWETQLQTIENHMINKDIRNFYQEVKKNKTLGQRTSFYRSKGETLIEVIYVYITSISSRMGGVFRRAIKPRERSQRRP